MRCVKKGVDLPIYRNSCVNCLRMKNWKVGVALGTENRIDCREYIGSVSDL